jgi:hypothetical protein
MHGPERYGQTAVPPLFRSPSAPTPPTSSAPMTTAVATALQEGPGGVDVDDQAEAGVAIDRLANERQGEPRAREDVERELIGMVVELLDVCRSLAARVTRLEGVKGVR